MEDEILDFIDDTEEQKKKEAKKWLILIVDDDADVHTSTRFALEQREVYGRGFRFIDAYNGTAGVDMVKKHPDIDLVLLDAVMDSTEDGIKCARFIRENIHKHIPPVIVMRSGYAADLEKDFRESGKINYVDEFVQKTDMVANTLVALMERWLPQNKE